MLWSLWIICILFAEKSKAKKPNTVAYFPLPNINFLHGLSLAKTFPIFNV